MLLKISIQTPEAAKATKRTIRTKGEKLTLGRVGCDIELQHPTCSRTHAILAYIPTLGLVLTDLESKNGTEMNGQKIKSTLVQDGDKFKIGEVEITLLVFVPNAELKEFKTKRLAEVEKVRLERQGILLGWPNAVSCAPKEKQAEWQALGKFTD